MAPLKYTRIQVFTDENEWEGYEDTKNYIHKNKQLVTVEDDGEYMDIHP